MRSILPTFRTLLRICALAGVLATFVAVIAFAADAGGPPPRAGSENLVVRLVMHSVIHPVAQKFLAQGIEEADREGAAALVVELDTPGGLLTSTREMTTAMLAAKTPVIVYVSPSGAQAASAGFFLLMASDFAAMAPATNTGAAHPVAAGGATIEGDAGKKAEEDAAATIRALATRRGRNVTLAEAAVKESRSFTADEAAKQGLVEVVAPDLSSVLAALEGKEFEKPAGVKRVFHAGGATVRELEMSTMDRILSTIAHPDIASILLTLGLLGLYFEFWHPGSILPGVVGGACLLLAFFAFSILPVNYVGVGLVALAVVFFIAEIKVTSHGLLAAGGIAALVGGLWILFRTPESTLRVSLQLIVSLAVTSALVVGTVLVLAIRALRSPVRTGREGLVGAVAEARTALEPRGKVFLQGEYWNAVAERPVAEGAEVEVVAVDGMTLKVRPRTDEGR